jgi:type I restriction enzyme M protein
MLTGELRNQIDGIWNDFWSGGLSNPLQVIEQITYLIFIKRLDEMQELEERKATTLSKPIERRIFPEGKDERGEPYANLRWSRFKHFAGPEMFRIVDEHVFPFIRELNGKDTAYARHMRDARFQIPGAALLAKVVDKIDRASAAPAPPSAPRDGDRRRQDAHGDCACRSSNASELGQARTLPC